MKPVRVIYHHEDEGWWAESPDLKGWTAVADSHEEIVQLVEEGIPFALECEAELERSMTTPPDQLPGVSRYKRVH